MGFRFRRRINLLPGVRLNLSKSGVSASVGRRGLWFTVGPRGTSETVGLPGTGLSYTEQQGIGAPPGDDTNLPISADRQSAEPATSSGGSMVPVCIVLLVLVVIAILIWMQ